MKTILITGGAGFIGSNLVNFIYKKYPKYKLIILDALTYAGNVQSLPGKGLSNDQIEFWYGNVLNADLVGSLVARSDIVIHFAAESHVTRSIYDNKLFFETDVLGTQIVSNSVLKNRKKVQLFVHISTSEVYGTAESDFMDENHSLNPMSPYAAAKCGADRLVYSYYQTYKIPCVIIRPFNNYGPMQHLEKLIPRFITGALLNEPLTIHGDGMSRRDFLHVDDHCEALDMLIHTNPDLVIGEIINLGSGKDLNILEIAEMISRKFTGKKIELRMIGDRPGQVVRHTADISKAYRILGWIPKILFEQGLEKTINWYEENTGWWESQKWMRQIPIVSSSGERELH
jgi:dTDP-glucose 4,6-dehydratase